MASVTVDRVLRHGQSGYPARLYRLHAPPPVLWARGPLPADAPRAVAVVGTRTATRSGLSAARELAAGLAERGIRIVSGLAGGIDGAEHRGALDVGGETTAVLGSGLGFRYPAENGDLYDRLPVDGLILTEFAPDVPPARFTFPRRNRIVAALADAVVVVQAGRRSGALITADLALDIGVEVCAVPGDVALAASAGCHALLRDGAPLVTCAADVLDVLGWETGGAPAAASEPRPRGIVLARLDDGPAGLDELTHLAGGVGAASLQLARLELAGEIEALPGGRYRRIPGEERERRAGRAVRTQAVEP